MNRRSGLLELELEGRRGTLFLSEGEVIDAEVGRFRGEKAFYRTLQWEGGKFEFRPQGVTVPSLIKRPGENLILEGLRQLDEVNKLRATLAPPGTHLQLIRRFEGPPERLKPVTREILKLLEYFTSLDDILNQSTLLDIELCSGLQTLVDRKIVAVVSTREEAGSPTAAQPLLSLEGALKLSYQLGVGREEGQRSWSGKVLLVAETADLLQRFLESLSRLKEFRIDASSCSEDTGTRFLRPGRHASGARRTELVLFAPGQKRAFRPLWEALANGAVGGIVLTGSFPPFLPSRASDARVAPAVRRHRSELRPRPRARPRVETDGGWAVAGTARATKAGTARPSDLLSSFDSGS
jgi:hypothetical protein